MCLQPRLSSRSFAHVHLLYSRLDVCTLWKGGGGDAVPSLVYQSYCASPTWTAYSFKKRNVVCWIVSSSELQWNCLCVCVVVDTQMMRPAHNIVGFSLNLQHGLQFQLSPRCEPRPVPLVFHLVRRVTRHTCGFKPSATWICSLFLLVLRRYYGLSCRKTWSLLPSSPSPDNTNLDYLFALVLFSSRAFHLRHLLIAPPKICAQALCLPCLYFLMQIPFPRRLPSLPPSAVHFRLGVLDDFPCPSCLPRFGFVGGICLATLES